jgi:hypothetical protein
MVRTPELRRLLEASTTARTKVVLVGDAYQLAPVKARGGMSEHLCDDLPWSQRLHGVWRMRDPAERNASLALRSARGNRLRKAVGWYRDNDRLHTGDAIPMAVDATNAYITARAQNVILCIAVRAKPANRILPKRLARLKLFGHTTSGIGRSLTP